MHDFINKLIYSKRTDFHLQGGRSGHGLGCRQGRGAEAGGSTVASVARTRDENGRKLYLFGNQFFSRFSLIANK
jgi:hypothetical protein